MTKYTIEQRKLIAEYLKSDVLTCEPTSDKVDKEIIISKINDLNKITIDDVDSVKERLIYYCLMAVLAVIVVGVSVIFKSIKG